MSEQSTDDIFRKEALDHHRKYGDFPEGELLHLNHRWLDRAYWIVLGVVVTALVFSFLAPIHEYASGPAVVRLTGQTHLTAKIAGTLASVEVKPGQRVSQGDVLVRFDEAEAASALDKVEREIELQTLKLLRDPTDQDARHNLAPLRAQKEQARAHLEACTVRAPHDGVVSDVRVRPWEHLSPGDTVASLSSDDSVFSVVALLPGEYRPMLRPGLPLRFELSGQRYLYQQLTLQSVGNEVVGPNEARRFLGQELADAISLPGPVVLVQARLPSGTFRTDGQTFHYYDGLLGRADASVRTSSLFVALVPWARRLFEHGD